MNRLDFHSVATLLQKHLIESADMTQIVFISTLFSCFVNDCDFSFDEGLCCKWMKGQAKISPKIVSYYQISDNKNEMYGDIEEELFLQISDVGALAEELYSLLVSDSSISELQRTKLLEFYDTTNTGNIAVFVSELLIFAMSRPFIKANLKATDTSPIIEDVILTTTIPKPIKSYVGRSKDLECIHQALTDNNVLFIHGIPGIGKSELMKAYCKEHKKDYTNILFLTYTGTLHELIADLDFVDDNASMSEKERFRKHFRFLKTLKQDSLIVIDNFDYSVSDDLLPQICDLKCNTVFTTQGHMQNYSCYELSADLQQSKEIFRTYCNDTTICSEEDMVILLETVNYHPMSVELLARLVSYAHISPSQLTQRLKENVLFAQDEIKLPLSKDNHNYKRTYHTHMESLLNLQKLDTACQSLLSVLALAPESGFPIKLLYRWYEPAINQITELENLGLARILHQRVVLNPYIRKLVNAQKLLSLASQENFFGELKNCLSVEESEHHKFALEIINTALRFVQKDSDTLWKSIVIRALERSNRLHQNRLFQKLLGEYEGICYLHKSITNDDRALLLHYKASEMACIHQNFDKAVRFEEQAIAEATGTGTSQIFHLSSFYLDAGEYYSKLMKPEKTLDYIQRSLDLLYNTRMLASVNGLSTTITFAKYLYRYGKFPKAAYIFNQSIKVIEELYNTETLTKGYLLQNLAATQLSMNNFKAATIHYSQAETILKKYLDDDHPDLITCIEQQKLALSHTEGTPILLDTNNVA